MSSWVIDPPRWLSLAMTLIVWRSVMGVVDVRVTGLRADLVVRRPEVLNAMSVEVFDALSNAADEIAKNDDLRVLVVSGEGRSFSSGIDTSSFGTAAGDPETA